MILENALKAFRAMGYKYGEDANGVIISANHEQMSMVVAQSISIMEGGTAPIEFHREQRRLEMIGSGSLRFYTADDVLNDNLKGYNFPFIASTQLALVYGGIRLEQYLALMNRSGKVPDVHRKYLTLENI